MNKSVNENGAIIEKIIGRCYWGPHKVTKKTVVGCVASYLPDEDHNYVWQIEITEEHVVKLKGE